MIGWSKIFWCTSGQHKIIIKYEIKIDLVKSTNKLLKLLSLEIFLIKKNSKKKNIIIGINVAKKTILTPAPNPMKIPIFIAIPDFSILDSLLRYLIV